MIDKECLPNEEIPHISVSSADELPKEYLKLAGEVLNDPANAFTFHDDFNIESILRKLSANKIDFTVPSSSKEPHEMGQKEYKEQRAFEREARLSFIENLRTRVQDV